MVLNALALAEEASIGFANNHMTIFAPAHLYNAFCQMGLTRIHWDDMEEVI